MRAFFLFLAAVLLSLAWLSPYHSFPWLTFSSEMLTFGAVLSLLTALSGQNWKIAKMQLWALPVVLVPLVQWTFGIVIDLSAALVNSFYLFTFWWAVVAGFNLALQTPRTQVLAKFSTVVMIVAVLTALIAILQWLGLDHHVLGVMDMKGGIRPFGNFAQPNNMSTFSAVGLMACLYLFEQRTFKNAVLIAAALFIMFGIALTQSRTAWVICLFFIAFWSYKTYKLPVRLRPKWMLVWVGCFVAMIALLPVVNALIAALGNANVVETATVAERATTGYLRFYIWTQMLLAIQQHPLVGFGWGQISLAQLTVFNLAPSHEWATSGHNILLDLLVMNGIPIGAYIIVYMAAWLLWLNRHAKTLESIVALLMVGAILTHAMLEFPLRYAYFLFPFGFLLGFVQAQSPQIKSYILFKVFVRCLVGVACIIMLLVWRDYTVYKLNSGAVSRGEPTRYKVLGSSDIWWLSQYRTRLDWLALNPTTSLSDDELRQFEKMVMNRASPYNLHKFAQLLLANGKPQEAKNYLFYLKSFYNENVTLQELGAENAASMIYSENELKRTTP